METVYPSVTVGDIAVSIDYGYTASAREKGLIKLLRITDIKDSYVSWDLVPFCDISDREYDKQALQKGDVVFARTGSIGNSFLIKELPCKVVAASYLIRVRPNMLLVDPTYLSYVFQGRGYWKQILSWSAGSTQKGVNASVLSTIKIPLPSLPEQRAIAGVLSALDDAIEKNELISSTVNRIDLEQLRMLRASSYEQVPLGDEQHFKVVLGQSPSSDTVNKKNKGLPFLQGSAEFGYRTPKAVSWCETAPKQSCAGDVLISVRAPVGDLNLSDVDYAIGRGVAAIRALNPVKPLYLYHVLRAYRQDIERAGSGSTFQAITGADLRRFAVPIPSVSDQDMWIRRFESLAKTTTVLQERADHLTQLKQGLLHELLSGERRVLP
jgi:type I restriction enzyme, S subunit